MSVGYEKESVLCELRLVHGRACQEALGRMHRADSERAAHLLARELYGAIRRDCEYLRVHVVALEEYIQTNVLNGRNSLRRVWLLVLVLLLVAAVAVWLQQALGGTRDCTAQRELHRGVVRIC
jgi:hypothetical protein